jgi:hypothetical protein
MSKYNLTQFANLSGGQTRGKTSQLQDLLLGVNMRNKSIVRITAKDHLPFLRSLNSNVFESLCSTFKRNVRAYSNRSPGFTKRYATQNKIALVSGDYVIDSFDNPSTEEVILLFNKSGITLSKIEKDPTLLGKHLQSFLVLQLRKHNNKPYVYIDTICGRGSGALMFNRTVNLARRQNIKDIRLSSIATAMLTYIQRYGFTVNTNKLKPLKKRSAVRLTNKEANNAFSENMNDLVKELENNILPKRRKIKRGNVSNNTIKTNYASQKEIYKRIGEIKNELQSWKQKNQSDPTYWSANLPAYSNYLNNLMKEIQILHVRTKIDCNTNLSLCPMKTSTNKLEKTLQGIINQKGKKLIEQRINRIKSKGNGERNKNIMKNIKNSGLSKNTRVNLINKLVKKLKNITI